MAKIYLSATSKDLGDHRRQVYSTLRRMRHDVIGMEDYVADERRPLDRVLHDVAASDLYVGIFAWRYGYVPPGADRSITEAEYREAGRIGIPRLVFLLREDAAWPASAMDAVTGEGDGGARIRALREELAREHVISDFAGVDELANLVGIAVYVQLELAASMEAAMVDADTALAHEVLHGDRVPLTEAAVEISTTLARSIDEAATSRVLEVDLGGGREWWSTRLFLLAALAAEFTPIRGVLFVDHGTFIGIAAPQQMRLRLAQAFPEVERVYAAARASVLGSGAGSASVAAAEIVDAFVSTIDAGAGGRFERDIKEWVTADSVGEWLGDDVVEEAVESAGFPVTDELLADLLAREPRFVPLVEGELRRVVGVVDRFALGVAVATSLLGQRLRTASVRS